MSHFKTNIERKTVSNTYYRTVLFTTKNMQLVMMSLLPGEEIGREKHPHTTQFIRVEKGRGKAKIGKKSLTLKDGDCLIIPPGKWHNIFNSGKKMLKLYTIYTPPEHPRKTKQKRKPSN